MKRAAAAFRLLRLCAAVVFAAAMSFAATDFARAQTPDCAAQNRVVDPDDNTKCGKCASGHLYPGSGNNCVAASNGFDTATFNNDCAGVNGSHTLLYASSGDATSGDITRNIGSICYNSPNHCAILTDPNIDLATQAGLRDADINPINAGALANCVSVSAYAPCTSPMVKKFPGNPFADCVPPSEVACGEGEYSDDGTCRCAAGFEPDGSGCDACTGGRTSEATTSSTNGVCACPSTAPTLDLEGENCGVGCLSGQQVDPDSNPKQCEVCPPGTYSPDATSQCISCANGVTGDVQNGGATSCTCNTNFEKNQLGECVPEVFRTVAISLAVNGTLAAKWSGDPDLADGDTVPDGTRVTFIATPDTGFYVTLWIGCPSLLVGVGGHEDGGEKECVATADADLTVAVVFADIDECQTDKKDILCHVMASCEDHPTPGADPVCKCGGDLPKGDGRTCLEKCPAGSGGDMCDEDLPKVEMVVPSGGVTLHATPEADCYVQGWTDSACADATGSSGETGSAGRKSCVSSGTGMVTVGVYFECGP